DDPTVRAVASDVPLDALAVPRFDLDDTAAIADFILAETGLTPGLAAPSTGDACYVPNKGKELATVAETQAMLRATFTPITNVERIDVANADGRVLAAAATALRNNPPGANSAMDGYGFAHASLAHGLTLALDPDRAAAGSPLGRKVAPVHAVRVLTGALLPEGVDTVAMQEHVTIDGDRITLPAGLGRGANTRAAGEDVAAGALALRAGTVLGPGEIGLLTALGVAQVSVRRRLRVGVLSTGDELAAPGSTMDPARTYDANRPMLLAMIRRWGHDAHDLGLVPDTRAALRSALNSAQVDVLLTSGGASAGDADHVSALLGDEGQIAQWRVALKPGKPLVLGQWGAMPVFGLPGNPVSAFVTALLFARPALALLAGETWPEAVGVEVPAGFSLHKRAGRREFLRAKLDTAGRAVVFRSDSSGMISSLAWATGFVELGEEACDIAPGDPVRFVPFGAFGL
ncbi:MAG TPA: bifunctional molybdopterin-guanine dinucleotide biosynthesis protein MobB/molybdopterin molybdotransferase MoeA, partial [Rhodobacterales bacterium]|nr:bifunctional molybdopterin-guanine dinucleotide biosynthesis protein MobB/molybdopterin molybdotransferase MoeA [Rhodobacterales bacterium]